MSNFLSYCVSNIDYIGKLLYNHIQYTLISVAIAIMIGIPVGIIIFNWRKLGKPVLSLANLVQAVPSLALLGFLIPYFGIGASTAIFMVVMYSLLPILKNTYTGLSSISPDMLEAAKGIGMTPTQVLFKVQIPLALPVIMAGIRISSVTAVGLMTIAAYIGADVLGSLVMSGIQTDNSYMILAGAIPACILALTMDFFMAKVEKAVTPISLRVSAASLTPAAVESLKRSRRATLLATAAVAAVIVGVFAVSSLSEDADIVIGSKEAVEGRVAANIIADIIEAKTDYTVERKLGLGGTMIAYEALKSGEIDLYPEYSGTALATILNQSYVSGTTSDEVFANVQSGLLAQDNLYALDSFSVNNTYILAVTADTAEKYGLETISDLTAVASRLVLGCSPEFAAREDGLLGVQDIYGLDFSAVKTFSGTLMYTAIDSDEVDIITAFATDSLISKYDLVLLEDDLNFFAPYDLFPFANSYFYSAFPDAVEALSEVLPLIDDETMSRLNGEVIDGTDAAEVSKNYLKEIGVID